MGEVRTSHVNADHSNLPVFRLEYRCAADRILSAGDLLRPIALKFNVQYDRRRHLISRPERRDLIGIAGYPGAADDTPFGVK